jgi:hypothetical protein
MKFPKSFELGGFTFTVKWVSNKQIRKEAGGDCWGYSQPAAGTIVLNKRMLKYQPFLAEQTFNHELMHCILWVVKTELWKDEALVDGIGHALLQVKKSSKY